MHATRWWQLADGRWSAEVVEHLIAGVVARDEGDAGTAVTTPATEVEPVDADRQVRKPLDPERFGPIRSGCSGPWQKSREGASNIVFMWYVTKVIWRIWMSLKFGA